MLVKKALIPNVFRIRHKNGTERIFEGVGNNLLDNPIVAGFVMNVHDITERKRMEKELAESENKYRELSIIDKEIFSPVPGRDIHVTVSIGPAQHKLQEDVKVFVHRVDQLMYQGKKNGKDRVCSDS